IVRFPSVTAPARIKALRRERERSQASANVRSSRSPFWWAVICSMECRSVMNSGNDKYGSSLDRPGAGGKPVDPATRLSELLAQSLDELTRPFDPPRGGAQPQVPGPHPARPLEPRIEPKMEPRFDLPPTASVAPPPPPREIEPPPTPVPAASPELARADADKALAELEAELFAAAKQVDRDETIPREDHAERAADALPPLPPALPHHDEAEAPPLEPVVHDTLEADLQKELAALSANAGSRPSLETRLPESSDSADASALIGKVRRLMLVSMAVTVIAVGSVFGFIGYRMIKGEGSTEKRADKLPAQGAA